jgi:hypothetical protein
MKQQSSSNELHYRLFYSVIVAGKTAKFAEVKTKLLFSDAQVGECGWPNVLKFLTDKKSEGTLAIQSLLHSCRVGNYKKITRMIDELLATQIDLRNCTPSELEKIHGIGLKTSRFFIMWTRPAEETNALAALDVHILRYMREVMGENAPKQTPTNPKVYEYLERKFVQRASELGMSSRQLDELIWTTYSGGVYDALSTKGE